MYVGRERISRRSGWTRK